MIEILITETEASVAVMILIGSFFQSAVLLIQTIEAHKDGIIGYYDLADGFMTTVIYGVIFGMLVVTVMMIVHIISA